MISFLSIGGTMFLGLLILAAYGVYVLVNGLFNPWHLVLVLAGLMTAVLFFHFCWVMISNLRKK